MVMGARSGSDAASGDPAPSHPPSRNAPTAEVSSPCCQRSLQGPGRGSRCPSTVKPGQEQGPHPLLHLQGCRRLPASNCSTPGTGSRCSGENPGQLLIALCGEAGAPAPRRRTFPAASCSCAVHGPGPHRRSSRSSGSSDRSRRPARVANPGGRDRPSGAFQLGDGGTLVQAARRPFPSMIDSMRPLHARAFPDEFVNGVLCPPW